MSDFSEVFNSDEKDLRNLMEVVDKFSQEMLIKLIIKKFEDNRLGWDNVENLDGIWKDLKWHVERGPQQAVDIANLAMMVWFLMERKK